MPSPSSVRVLQLDAHDLISVEVNVDHAELLDVCVCAATEESQPCAPARLVPGGRDDFNGHVLLGKETGDLVAATGDAPGFFDLLRQERHPGGVGLAMVDHLARRIDRDVVEESSVAVVNAHAEETPGRPSGRVRLFDTQLRRERAQPIGSRRGARGDGCEGGSTCSGRLTCGERLQDGARKSTSLSRRFPGHGGLPLSEIP
jgi:hypothetical protein